MKDLHGRASAAVGASPERCFALFADLEAYPRWYPEAVRRVEVVERSADGLPARARTLLHLGYGPVVRDFELLLAVLAEPPSRLELARIPHDAADPEQFEVTWLARPGRIELELRANLSVPRVLPIGGIGGTLAEGFVGAAARALSRSR